MAQHAGDATTDRSVILALRRLNSAFTASNRAVGSRLGIRDGDLAVLDCLHQEGPQTPTELAHRTRTHVATMTGILARLERDGWIERRPTGTDRRSVQIHATGVDRLTEVYAPANAEFAGLLETWTPDRRRALVQFLTQAGDIASAFADRLGEDSSTERHRGSPSGPISRKPAR